MKAETIVILGLGRLGASIGLAVKKKLSMNVIGHDPNLSAARIAQEKVGAVDAVENNLLKAVSKADILVVTTPVSELQETLKIIGSGVQSHTLILDLSHLKGPGLKWARQYVRSGHYVGAMPILAAQWLHDGRAETISATADLFQNSLLCVMPAPDADPQAVETAVNFGRVIGAQPYFIDPGEYDNLIQGTETLPGLMAVALMKALQRSTSWNDILKFAGQPLALATLPLAYPEDLSLMAVNDKEATLRWLEAIVKELNDLRKIIYESEPQVVTAVIEAPSIEREKWLHKRQENNWDERTSPDVEQPTMFGQMFGGLAAGSKKKGQKD